MPLFCLSVGVRGLIPLVPTRPPDEGGFGGGSAMRRFLLSPRVFAEASVDMQRAATVLRTLGVRGCSYARADAGGTRSPSQGHIGAWSGGGSSVSGPGAGLEQVRDPQTELRMSAPGGRRRRAECISR